MCASSERRAGRRRATIGVPTTFARRQQLVVVDVDDVEKLQLCFSSCAAAAPVGRLPQLVKHRLDERFGARLITARRSRELEAGGDDTDKHMRGVADVGKAVRADSSLQRRYAAHGGIATDPFSSAEVTFLHKPVDGFLHLGGAGVATEGLGEQPLRSVAAAVVAQTAQAAERNREPGLSHGLRRRHRPQPGDQEQRVRGQSRLWL